MPRTTKLNEEVTKKIVKAIKGGNFITVAVVYAGITTTAYYNWRERADKAESLLIKQLETNAKAKLRKSDIPFIEFRDTIDFALSVAEVMAVTCIRASFTDDWKAAAWYLERRYPEKWGKRVIGFANDDGTKNFANAFANAIKEVEDDEMEMSAKIVPIK